ncbi:Putative AC transposase, partial [Linum perenne]
GKKKKKKTFAYQYELENYLNEDVIPWSPNFDILVWWKMNGVKFRTLQATARDLLVFLVTLVASESSFSVGGRLLDPQRGRLHCTTV